MSNKFKIGDVVKLKSNGPEMTVGSLYEAAVIGFSGEKRWMACCHWFRYGTNVDQQSFDVDALDFVR